MVFSRYGASSTNKIDCHFITEITTHQTRWSRQNSRPISAEIALFWLQSEIKVASFLFASRFFLANNLCFMVNLINKVIVINVKIHKNDRKRLYSSNKENLTCWDKSITTFSKFILKNSSWKLNPKSKNNQADASCTKCIVGLCYIFYYYFNTTWVIFSFFQR